MRRPLMMFALLLTLATSCALYDPIPDLGFRYGWGDSDFDNSRSPLRGFSGDFTDYAVTLTWHPRAPDVRQARIESFVHGPDGEVFMREPAGSDPVTGAELFDVKRYIPAVPDDPDDWPAYVLLVVGVTGSFVLLLWSWRRFRRRDSPDED